MTCLRLTKSFWRNLLPIVLLAFLSGCVGMSEWLSGPVSPGRVDRAPVIAQIQTNVSTQEDVSRLMGTPAARRTHLLDDSTIEAWAYHLEVYSVKPHQYLPLLGAIAFTSSQSGHSQSVAISFDKNGRMSGLTDSTMNAYGDVPSVMPFPETTFPIFFYGSSLHPHETRIP